MLSDITLDCSASNYAVFGNPICHSKSPVIHSLFAKQQGICLNYQAIEVSIENFSACVYQFFEKKGKGLNITVPFKGNAFSLCDVLTERAKLSTSVNTLWSDKQNKIHGDTTDGKGLINDLIINNQLELNNKSILVLGAGGSVRAILEPLCLQKPKHITIVNRTVSKAEQLAKIFSDHAKIHVFSYDNLPNKPYDFIINGTSLSLNSTLPMISKTTIDSYTCCYDLMYLDTDTIFMQWAASQGALKVMDGLGMLVEQAAEAFNIWHRVMPDTKPIITRLRGNRV